MMAILTLLLALLIGSWVGKFMALTAHFLPEILFEGGEKEREPRHIFNLFFQRPVCWQCAVPLAWGESIPIFGYLSSRRCQHPYGLQLFLLELGTALLFGLSSLLFPLDLPLVFVLFISCLMICCFVTDFEEGILPDQFTLLLVWVGLIGSLRPIFITPQESIIGAVVGYAILWGVNLIYRYFRGFDGMFPGDFKLNAGIGACLGIHWFLPILAFSLLLLVVVTLAQAFFSRKRADVHQEVPYACFASIVTVIALYYALIVNGGIDL
jgi:leader peptidase (prepilin peptidase)/N-methyltransferase